MQTARTGAAPGAGDAHRRGDERFHLLAEHAQDVIFRYRIAPPRGYEFISSISHDLRTPLAAIKASVGVVLANEPPGTSEALRRMLVNIDSAADDLSEMVANLLEIARLQAHAGEIRRDWIDLRAIARR